MSSCDLLFKYKTPRHQQPICQRNWIQNDVSLHFYRYVFICHCCYANDRQTKFWQMTDLSSIIWWFISHGIKCSTKFHWNLSLQSLLFEQIKRKAFQIYWVSTVEDLMYYSDLPFLTGGESILKRINIELNLSFIPFYEELFSFVPFYNRYICINS